jgi:xylulokinase
MYLMGIDVGTTGCKAAVFSETGALQSLSYAEYEIQRPRPYQAELDAPAVWQTIAATIGEAVAGAGGGDRISALSVTSMGENVVPVSADRRVLGPSILNVDQRGIEYVPALSEALPNEELHEINGNVWGNQYSLPKLMWIRDHQPDLYEKARYFLHWGSFVLFMLGGEAVIDYALANRSLLFDIRSGDWSDELLRIGGIDRGKLPRTVRAGESAGTVSAAAASATGLQAGTPLFAGTHDQCANALGCGVVEERMAMYGMGTFPTIAPVFGSDIRREVMIANGLNTEHHAVPDKFIAFLFHMGGATVKWYRETFGAGAELSALLGEMPASMAPLLVLPRFAPMGPPDYEEDPCAVIEGLSLETSRGDILKAILEANTMALNVLVEKLPEAGIEVDTFHAVGGGSRSDAGLQIAADILGKPLIRADVTESGALGAALLAGIGAGTYSGFGDAARATAGAGRTFEPDPGRQRRYSEVFGLYKEFRSRLAPLTAEWVALRQRIAAEEAGQPAEG